MDGAERLEGEITQDMAAFNRLIKAGVDVDLENPRMRAMAERLLANWRKAQVAGLDPLPASARRMVQFLEDALPTSGKGGSIPPRQAG